METFSIRNQPAIIDQVLRWLLLHHFADEGDVFLVPYGHSMGGLALSQTDMVRLLTAVTRQGRHLRIQKVLSAPAFVLHENARSNLRQLIALKTIKRKLGRVPLYEVVAGGLFRSLAPILYRRDAENYSLNPDCTFLDFRRYNPFILLDQGLELLKLEYGHERMAALLEGSHLILCTDDDMVDSNALMHAVKHANGSGAAVQLHLVDSSHNAERDDPDLILDSMCKIMKPLVTGSYEPARQTAVAG